MDQVKVPIKKVRSDWRGVPQPQSTVESIQATVEALKENVEILTNQREGGVKDPLAP